MHKYGMLAPKGEQRGQRLLSDWHGVQLSANTIPLHQRHGDHFLVQMKLHQQGRGWTIIIVTSYHNLVCFTGPHEREMDAWDQCKKMIAAKGYEFEPD